WFATAMTVMAIRVYGWRIRPAGPGRRGRSPHGGGAGATLPPRRGPIRWIRAATERTKYAPVNEPDAPSGPPRPNRRLNMQGHPDDDALLTPSEAAAMFRVNPKTVTRWPRAGKISAIRTLGGHRRFRASEIRHFLDNVEEAESICRASPGARASGDRARRREFEDRLFEHPAPARRQRGN